MNTDKFTSGAASLPHLGRLEGAGFGFTNNNPAINGYFYPGMQFRVGIFWSFVN
jgi:hypothetical protein